MTDAHTEHEHDEHGHGGDPDPEIAISPIAKSIVALVVTTVAFAVLMIPLVFGFNEAIVNRVDDDDRVAPARPSGPLLQPSPEAEMELFREEQKRLVDEYGWSDKTNGLARIPVSRARALILSEGVGPVGAPASAETEGEAASQ